MFRYEVGATILVKQYDNTDYEPIQVKILAKSPRTIKVEILSGNWFRVGDIHILTADRWFSIGRMV